MIDDIKLIINGNDVPLDMSKLFSNILKGIPTKVDSSIGTNNCKDVELRNAFISLTERVKLLEDKINNQNSKSVKKKK